MKKTWIALLGCLVFLLGFAITSNAEEKTYNLKMQTYYSPGNFDHIKAFAKDIEDNSKGRIKIELYSGGELVSSNNMLKAISSGMIDIAQGCGPYYSELKIGSIEMGMPMAWLSPKESEQIFYKDGLLQLVAKEYAKAGATYLGVIWAAPYQIATKKPVNSLADLKTMKIRAIGANAKVLQALGVATVSMPPEDLYLALSTGQVDGALYGAPFEFVLTKYYEVAPYLLNTPIVDPLLDNVIINSKLWEGMPKDLQAVVMKAVENARSAYYDNGQKESAKALENQFKGKITVLPPEDITTLTKAAQAVWDEEAAKSPDNAKAVEIIRAAAKKAGRI